MKTKVRLLSVLMVVLLSILACQIPKSTPSPDTSLMQTQTAISMTLTAMNNIPPTATRIALPTATRITLPTAAPQQTLIVPTSIGGTGGAGGAGGAGGSSGTGGLTPQQIQDKINSSNILIYEDMAGYQSYIRYVSKAITSIGGNHVYVGDAMGTFMDKLDSDTKWDLIIVASEYRDAISGDYWTTLKQQVDKGVALIVEVWYLDKISNGKVTPLLNECGVEVQGNWNRSEGFNQIDYGMYWVVPDSPVFNTPNQVARFSYSVQDAWIGDAGDFLQLTSGSNAKILASHSNGHTTDYGLLTSCLDGRVLFQTFSSHDYPMDGMVSLWQNYIMYTLTNHFQTAH